MADPAPHSLSFTRAIVIRTILVIAERNSGVRLEARFAFAAEHPDHYAYERDDKEDRSSKPRSLTSLSSGSTIAEVEPAVVQIRRR